MLYIVLIATQQLSFMLLKELVWSTAVSLRCGVRQHCLRFKAAQGDGVQRHMCQGHMHVAGEDFHTVLWDSEAKVKFSQRDRVCHM